MKAFRGEILHFLDDPARCVAGGYQYFEDGLLIVDNGCIHEVGNATDLMNKYVGISVTHYPQHLIMPGFIDTHVHYPQTDMVASYGCQLLDWLEEYTFPEEKKFSNEEHAADVAQFFLEELLRAGTTTALVFGTVHPESVDAFFKEAEKRNLRMICGKVLMDRNCPEYLQDTPEKSYSESKALIEKWHGKGRLQYAVTPRFAPTSSVEQLEAASRLLKEHPTVYLHTHLSENKNEIEWVKSLFPDQSTYLDVYDRFDFLTKRSVFAHGIHLSDDECHKLGCKGSGIAFCPSSNLFLGSGCFNLDQAKKFEVNIGLGTDIGAGTSFSMLATTGDAYKTQQLTGNSLDALQMLYLATLGGARTLDLADKIGNFESGKEADFIVIDYKASRLMERRIARCKTLAEKLFVLNILGDDRHVGNTYIMGEKSTKT